MEKIAKTDKILMIVESPNKIKALTAILGKLGYKSIKIVATIGHTAEIANASDSYMNTGVYPDKNFKIKYQIAPDKAKRVKEIKDLAEKADIVLLASDPDREGEAISAHIKSEIKLPDKKYYRIKYHSITESALKEAFAHPEKIDENLADAAEARGALDKMMGYALSPIAKTYVGAKSVGRCQSAGLKLIADREREIQNFKPEAYFDLYLLFSKNKSDFRAKYVGTDEKPVNHLSTKAEAQIVIDACAGKEYKVLHASRKLRSESPKPPFSTATFQQEASSKLNISVNDAMSCAQHLFEAGRITYHRTDSSDFSADFKAMLKAYIEKAYGKDSYAGVRTEKAAAGAQEGHEALRCTDPALTPDKAASVISDQRQLRVYRLIWQRTVASAMPDAKIAETVYAAYNSGYRFEFKSDELLAQGYRLVYSYAEAISDAGEPQKESFSKNEVLQNAKLELQKKQTQPKPRYKESTLVKELQRREIGRPSTYATIVSTVLSDTRGYCTLDSKKFMVPTERGLQLSAFLDRAFPNMINLDYTKELESNLDKIADGKETKTAFLQAFYNELESSIHNNKELGKTPELAAEAPCCPVCGARMVLRRSRFGGLFYGCSNFPRCRGLIDVKDFERSKAEKSSA